MSLSSLPSFPVGLTYDDVLLVPQKSPVRSRKTVRTCTRLSRNIKLQIPIVASNMDTVCEHQTAIAMAREGGIGILHRFCSIKEQCDMLSKVKRAQSFLIENPRMIMAHQTSEEALEGLKWKGRKGGVGCLMVVDGLSTRKLLGIITRQDLVIAEAGEPVSKLMTPIDRLVVSHDPGITLDEAREMMRRHRMSNLPIIGKDNSLMYLVTLADVVKLTQNRYASLDVRGRLLVGAAVGVKKDDLTRAAMLVEAGADVLVVDIAHGHSSICIDMLKQLKADPRTNKVDIVAGNIATGEAAEELIQAGADGLKIGVGPGSICTTRLVAGSGVPQLSAVLACTRVARKHGVPCIADGGIKTGGDICKAIAAGADTVMVGNLLAGTDEAPGRVLVKDGKKVKIIRGMAGFGANLSKAERESTLDEDAFAEMVPEGVEGSVPCKGPLSPIVRQLVGGLRSGMSYSGACTIKEMHEKAQFVRMTGSGLRESGSHDISKL
ncbi:putative guanosine monophosphate reductase [Trypanosoma rangeli]|uniref:Inosine-5'-monophosphate dehydrogenase n=1 Tax=Trypanosoma rangeli TaxID=5698 RepID=A0A422N4U4_TRYRA|nr:putative guanosine monophosphate reductase [Trypanosoma rangeli]RNF00451.1 putative guanosine monophosphate reductase [Trypanosoma rangeli]|eukprot:RNF00451.1 putative guanosine monophosphate reductase [Trypanosoma rangeli]